ncbi:MAG: NUDIX hydrolase [Pseudomonadota bacterium]|nr:NUDIX hydrolase [Pseudomonadota bacterium]
MHRERILKLLHNYECKYPEEQVYKKNIMDFIHMHSDCFERSCRIGHLTASSFLLNYEEDKALLMHHTKLGIWLQLGGHCDGDPDVAAVALKEAREESGIEDIDFISTDIYDVDMHLVPARKKDPSHYHYDIRFLLKVTNPNLPIKKNSESLDLRWFSHDVTKLPTQQRSVTRMFDKWTNLRSSITI